MTVLTRSEHENKLETAKLTQVVHRNRAGEVLRVSVYSEKTGEERPACEMIHYPDGSTSFHLYNESGDVKHRFKLDKNGHDTPYVTRHRPDPNRLFA